MMQSKQGIKFDLGRNLIQEQALGADICKKHLGRQTVDGHRTMPGSQTLF